MDGIARAGSAMVAARARLEIATQNLANVSTDGFERVAARGSLTREGVTIARRPDALTHGALRRTGRDFDLAIVGAGAFAVEDAAGRQSLTRAGAFTRERDGTLRDALGRTLTAGGHPLRVPDGARVDAARLHRRRRRAHDRPNSAAAGQLDSERISRRPERRCDPRNDRRAMRRAVVRKRAESRFRNRHVARKVGKRRRAR